MYLSELIGLSIYTGKESKGVCRGVGISLKSHAVKYLLCASEPASTQADFAVNVSAVEKVGEVIRLTRLRPVFPKNCARIFPKRPIYSCDGINLGNIADMEMREFAATQLITEQGESFPVSAIAACSDAVILRKEQPFPLGQRVPAPFLSIVTNKPDAVVTKPVLRNAIAKGTLIKLTLSLPPFNVEFHPFPRLD